LKIISFEKRTPGVYPGVSIIYGIVIGIASRTGAGVDVYENVAITWAALSGKPIIINCHAMSTTSTAMTGNAGRLLEARSKRIMI
jgi:hypothetical protein